jgi:hypothetical protein
MKNIFLFLLFLIFSQVSWGRENLFSFLREHKLGTKVAVAAVGVSSPSEVELVGHKFEVSYSVDKEKAIKGISIYLRKNSRDGSPTTMQRIHQELTSEIVATCGNVKHFNVPNFEDATERDCEMSLWKNKNNILTLEKTVQPGDISIQIDYVELDYYKSTLGADLGDFMLSKLQTHAGKLRISADEPEITSSKNGNAEHNEIRVDNQQAGKDLKAGAQSGASIIITLVAIVVLSALVLLTRKFFYKNKNGK